MALTTANPVHRSRTSVSPSRSRSSSSSEHGARAGMPLFLRAPPGAVQAKLTVNAPGDPFEQEADQVADRATQSTSLPGSVPAKAVDAVPGLQRKCAACAAGGSPCPKCEEEAAQVQRKSGADGAGISGKIQLNPPDNGSALKPEVRDRVEPVLGADLGAVRVHDSPAANATAAQLDARAFTHGNHIWLGASQSSTDVALLAHEATHVVQQGAAPEATPSIQRAPADYQHPEDGGNVLGRMQARISEATTDADEPASPTDDAASDAPVPTPETRRRQARSAATSIDRSKLAEQRSELEPDARPDVDRPASEQPRVEQAAATTQEEVQAPSEPVGAEAADASAAGAPQDGKGGAKKAAKKAASLADQAFAAAEAVSAPDTPPAVQPPAPVQPVDSSGQTLPADPEADAVVTALSNHVQQLRTQSHIVQAHAAESRRNAAVLDGNIAMVRDQLQGSDQAVTTSRDHLSFRRETLGQARQALAVSEQKAQTVAEGAPEFGAKADEGKQDSGPMASEASGLAAENAANTPEDAEAAEKAQEQGSQMTQAGGEIATTDDAITQTQTRAASLGEEAAQAKELNQQSAAKLDATDATLQQTDDRLAEMTQSTAAARGGVEGLASGPARVRAQAATLDQQGSGLLQASIDLEARIVAMQANYAAGMAAVPKKAEPHDTSEPDAVVQREGYGDREKVDLASGMPSWLSGQDPVSDEQRATAAAETEERRRKEIREITEEAGGNFDQLGAASKMGIALRLTGRNLFGGLGKLSWPGWGGLASGAGHLAAGLIDPRGPLLGVVSGFGMMLSGGANLLSGAQWKKDPLGNLLKSAADIATGLTIILGSITALAGVVIAIMTAITILSFGTAAPVTGPVIAFCSTVLTTVGGWTIAVGKVALVLQALVFIKNLIDAATAQTADQLQQSSDRMTEDASNAGNVVLQIGMAKLSQIGGRQMQSAVREAGGGVRFAAQLGARGPVGSAVAGVQSQGFRGYASQVASGARSSLRNAGSYLVKTSVTEGAKDLGVAARNVWRGITTAEGPSVSGSQGVSRDFLVGSEVPKGSFGAGSSGIVGDELRAAGIQGPRSTAVTDLPAPAPALAESGTPAAQPHAVVETPSEIPPPRPADLPAGPSSLTAEEAQTLHNTGPKGGAELTPDEALAELSLAERAGARPGEPVELPNNHTIEPNSSGGFCRRSLRICFDRNGEMIRPKETLHDMLAEAGVEDVDAAVETLLAAHNGDAAAAVKDATKSLEAHAEVVGQSARPVPPAPASHDPNARVAQMPEPHPLDLGRSEQIDLLIQLRKQRAALGRRTPADVRLDPVRQQRWNDYLLYYDERMAQIQTAINMKQPILEPPLRWSQWEDFQILRESTQFQSKVSAELQGRGYEVADEPWISNPKNPNPRVGPEHPDWRPDQLAVNPSGEVTAVSNKQRDFRGTPSGTVSDVVRDDVREVISKYSGTIEIHRPAGELPPRFATAAPGGRATVSEVIIAYDGNKVPVEIRAAIVDRANSVAKAINPGIKIEVIFQ